MCPEFGEGEADVCWDMLCYSRTVEARGQAYRVAVVLIVHRMFAVLTAKILNRKLEKNIPKKELPLS
jgi:hypothetical protein